MRIRRLIRTSAVSLLLPLVGAGLAVAADGDGSKSQEKNPPMVSEPTGDSEKNIDDSFNPFTYTTKIESDYKESFNSVYTSEFNENFLGVAVSANALVGAVSGGNVHVGSDAVKGAEAKTSANSSVKLDGSALSGFSGVNTMILNAGHNSLQQQISTITIAAGK